jgi:hypothetical protein
MIQRRYRIGALHALANAIPTTQDAFDRVWPEADVAHLLDGSLYLDRNAGTADDDELAARIDRLIQYSATTGTEALIVTGSFFGEAAIAARNSVTIPVATSFDGVIERALELGRGQPLHVLSTTPDSAVLLSEAINAEASQRGASIDLSNHPVTGALDALTGGDPARHDALVLEAIGEIDANTAIVFAQFSMERILPASAEAHPAPVVGPASEGVAYLRRRITAP